MNAQGYTADILCVDDDERNLRLMEALLSPQGYGIRFAKSGEDAIKEIARKPPDLILLDVMMPQMSGYDVLNKLRADLGTRLIPIILLTALREEKDRIMGIEAGCDDFISKPFEKAEVLARVKSLLKISFYRRQLDEKEKFEMIIHEMLDGAIVCGPGYEVTDINESAKRYLNISDPKNLNFLDFIFDNYSVSVGREELIGTSSKHKIFEIIRPPTDKFKPLYLEAILDILRNPDGEVVNIVLVLRDVTEVRREETLKQEFLGLISHKLRTPVTIIRSGLDYIKDAAYQRLKEDERKIFLSVEESGGKLTKLIEKLIQFTTINTSHPDLPKEEITLSESVPLVTEPFLERAGEKRVNIKIDIEDTGINIQMNKFYFDLILDNLLDNAVKFNDKEEVDIVISAKRTANGTQISVKDNGPGIPSEERVNIFRKFYQVEKYFTGQVEGVGLGLAAVKQLVDSHGGQVDVNSTLGRGTEFKITLPA